MHRKFFRKYLPSHESILGHRWMGRFGRFLQHPNLWYLNRGSVAGGVAVGMLSGLVPGPLQMLTALFAVSLFMLGIASIIKRQGLICSLAIFSIVITLVGLVILAGIPVLTA